MEYRRKPLHSWQNNFVQPRGSSLVKRDVFLFQIASFIFHASRRKMFLFFLTILLISRTIDYWKIEFREWSYATISRFFYRNSKVLVLFFHIRCGKCFVSKHIYIIFVYLCMKVYDNCCTMHKLDYREFKFD